MAFDRQSIERTDFPIGRRGYDPAAVDAHLSAVASEVERLAGTAAGRGESLAGAASAQVRAIVEAAEATAEQIRTEAAVEATRIRKEVAGEATAARSQAAAQAGERVAQVTESAAAMLERIQTIDRELNALLDSLRTGATRLSADLKLLQDDLADARQAASPGPEAAPAAPAAERSVPPQRALDGAAELEDERAIELAEDAAVGLDDEPTPAPAPTAQAARSEAADADLEGARLIALNMALNGTSREEIDRYLAENFDLANRSALLDDVYASVEG